MRLWSGAVGALEKGDWVESSRQLGMLQSEKKEAWTWNEKALGEKAKAVQSKAMLDALLHGSQSLKREDIGFADLLKDQEVVDKVLAEAEGGVPTYLQKLKADLEDTREKLKAAIRESQGMETAMDQLNKPFPPYAEILNVV